MKKLVLLMLILTLTQVKTQSIEDAIRISMPNAAPSARSAGLGIAYMGIVDDIAAANYNPAGLTLLPKSEISLGFDFLSNKNTTKLGDNISAFRSNSESFSHIGIASPFQFSSNQNRRGCIAIVYHKEANYNQDFNYQWFNEQSTMLSTLSPIINDHIYTSKDNLSQTPVLDSLLQKGEIFQSGGLHNVTGAVGFEINENVSLGFSIFGKFGTYDYKRDYTESDIYNIYNTRDDENYSTTDFKSLELKERYSQDITGISGAIGLLGKIGKNVRVSVGIKFPTYFEIKESYSLSAQSEFDDGFRPNPYTTGDLSVSYKVKTPFAYSGGLSFYAEGLVFSAGIEYRDVSQLEYTDISLTNSQEDNQAAIYNKELLNKLVVQELVGQVTWGFGAEYSLSMLPLAVRASYSSTTSPYSIDVSGANVRSLALGAGFSFAQGFRLDAVMTFKEYSEFRTNYANDINSRYIVTANPVIFGLSLTMRI